MSESHPTIEIGHEKVRYLYSALSKRRVSIDDTLIEYFVDCVRRRAAEKVFRTALRVAKKLKITDITDYLDMEDHGFMCLVDKLRAMRGHVFTTRVVYAGMVRELGKRLEWYRSRRPTRLTDIDRRLRELSELFELNTEETRILVLLFLRNTDFHVDHLFDYLARGTGIRLRWGNGHMHPTIASHLTGISPAGCTAALGESGGLVRGALVDQSRDITESTAAFLMGHDTSVGGRSFFEVYSGTTLPLDAYTVAPEDVEVIRTLITNHRGDRALHILLYGEPGSGKTSFARSLGAALNMHVCDVYHSSTSDYAVYFRARALMSIRKTLDLSKNLIVVDEADAMLNIDTERSASLWTSEKGLVNRCLDALWGTCIWIVNRTDSIDDSTRRPEPTTSRSCSA